MVKLSKVRNIIKKQKHVSSIFLLVWLFAIAVGQIEAYFYQGFFLKHLHFDSILVYVIFGILGLALFYISDDSDDRSLTIYQKIYSIAIFIFGLIFFFFYILEKKNYPNYVFSTYHLQPKLLSTPLTLSIFASIFSSKKLLHDGLKNSEHLFRWFSIVAIFIWILIMNFIDIVSSSSKNLYFMINEPNATYGQRMQEKIGKQFYDYVMFVKENTSENSKILLPPFPAYPWPQTGNIPYMTYFLYPRTLFNGGEYSPEYDLQEDGIDYVLLDWGETEATSGVYTHGWPKFDVNADQITYFLENNETKIEHSDYIYGKVEGKELWGIIKVKK